MENFLKHLLTKNNILILLIFLIAGIIRFYNFPNRITFWTEQARSLIVSANYIHEKPSLLGQEYFRQDSNSHIIYSGALFNYSLVPLLLISNYDPIKITIYFAVLNLFTGLVIYLVTKKIFEIKIATIASILFLFNDLMIYHSLFIWNYNYLPLIGVLLFYFSWKYIKWHKTSDLFLIALFSGIGISIQFLFIPIALVVFTINILKSKQKFLDTTIFLFGLSIANLPLILFDIRHNFYETRTLIQYFVDTIKGKSDAGFAYYYFLPFWPVITAFGGWLIYKVIKWKSSIGVGLLVLYLFINLTSQKISFNKPIGMPPGIKVKDIDMASNLIASDVSGLFNVAEVLDFDKKAYVLRYYSEFKYGKKPLGDTEYQNLNTLYVLAQKGYNFENSNIWEIYTGGKYNTSLLSDVGQGYGLYKLNK